VSGIDDEEAFRNHMTEARAADERAQYEQAIKKEKSATRAGLIFFAISARNGTSKP
jgi:hypothetical protein